MKVLLYTLSELMLYAFAAQLALACLLSRGFILLNSPSVALGGGIVVYILLLAVTNRYCLMSSRLGHKYAGLLLIISMLLFAIGLGSISEASQAVLVYTAFAATSPITVLALLKRADLMKLVPSNASIGLLGMLALIAAFLYGASEGLWTVPPVSPTILMVALWVIGIIKLGEVYRRTSLRRVFRELPEAIEERVKQALSVDATYLLVTALKSFERGDYYKSIVCSCVFLDTIGAWKRVRTTRLRVMETEIKLSDLRAELVHAKAKGLRKKLDKLGLLVKERIANFDSALETLKVVAKVLREVER